MAESISHIQEALPLSQDQKWVEREQELLSQISNLEVKLNEEHEKNSNRLQTLQEEIQKKSEDCKNFKNKIDQLETELAEIHIKGGNALSPTQQAQIDKVKQMSEEMLTKAKGVIFDKTKVCKNQELQIEALTSQVTSLKEVLGITKELLEIRNIEVSHLQEKLNCMEDKIGTERERRDLMDQKLNAMVKLNQDLKEEYQLQLKLFNVLKDKYHQHDQCE